MSSDVVILFILHCLGHICFGCWSVGIFWNFGVFELSRFRVFEFSSCRVVEFPSFHLFAFLSFRGFAFSSSRVVEISSFRVVELSGVRVVEFSSFQGFAFSSFRVFEISSFRIFEFCLEVGRMGGRGGGCVQNHNKHIGQSSFSCLWNWVGAGGGASGLNKI